MALVERIWNIKKGQVLNPNGRPKGAKTKSKSQNIKERILGKWKTHPVDKLVALANHFETAGRYDAAAEIWMTLLKYCESPKKAAVASDEKPADDDSEETEAESERILEELEQNGISPIKSSEGNGVAKGPIVVPPEASPETDLPGHTEQ